MAAPDELRNRLIDAGLLLFDNNESHLAVEALCEEAGCTVEAFYSLFDSPIEVIQAQYARCIPDLEEDLPDNIEERLAYFLFSLLDNLEENREWVLKTFKPYVLNAWFENQFRPHLKKALQKVLQGSEVSGGAGFALTKMGLDSGISEAIIQVLGVWSADNSEEQVRSLALLDRFIQMVVSWVRFDGFDLTFELLKYLVNIEVISIPDWLQNLSKKSFKEKENR